MSRNLKKRLPKYLWPSFNIRSFSVKLITERLCVKAKVNRGFDLNSFLKSARNVQNSLSSSYFCILGIVGFISVPLKIHARFPNLTTAIISTKFASLLLVNLAYANVKMPYFLWCIDDFCERYWSSDLEKIQTLPQSCFQCHVTKVMWQTFQPVTHSVIDVIRFTCKHLASK